MAVVVNVFCLRFILNIWWNEFLEIFNVKYNMCCRFGLKNNNKNLMIILIRLRIQS